MPDWHHGRQTDLGLRLAGVALCGVSWLAIRALVHLHMPHLPASPGLPAFALAAVGCLCASLGMALLVHGHHVLDEVEISVRWRRQAQAAQPSKWLCSTGEVPPDGGEALICMKQEQQGAILFSHQV